MAPALETIEWVDWAVLAGIVAGVAGLAWVIKHSLKSMIRFEFGGRHARDTSCAGAGADYVDANRPCVRMVQDNFAPAILWSPPRDQSR
jgi:hypothetical protein